MRPSIDHPREPAVGSGEAPHADAIVRDLREQVAVALRALLDAFQGAGIEEAELLRSVARAGGQTIYAGLVTALMRLVVVLFAEERGLLPVGSERYRAAYSLGALYADLSERASAEEFGAWARILRLFRLVYAGPTHPDDQSIAIPWVSREGPARLFDPDAYPFLEGRAPGEPLENGSPRRPPRISDAAVRRVLDLLLCLRGERQIKYIKYKTLDVEHIGSLYEGLMGFSVEEARERAVALLPDRYVVSPEALLAMPGPERIRFLRSKAGVELSERLTAAVRDAASADEIQTILARRAPSTGPAVIEPGTLYLQPGEGRRRAGSYYTPRALAREVVARALAPLLRRGERDATPGEILELKVCDPAAGSGAFLVEACRQLASALEAALDRSANGGGPSSTSAGGRARRLVVERCLYGVDVSPLAVELAKVSLWLLAEAPDLPLALLDARVRCGNSLLGADVEDLSSYPFEAWKREPAPAGEKAALKARARACEAERAELDAYVAPESQDPEGLRRMLDAWTAIWFWPAAERGAPTPKTLRAYLAAARAGDHAAAPRASRRIAEERRFFHWRAELPDVFARPQGGFDAIVGNPPWVAYAGRAAQPIEPSVFSYLVRRNPAFFGYRSLHGLFVWRCASLLRPGGRLGLVVPTSVSDLDGYEAVRSAHDDLCDPDADLPDFGSDAFDGVFQPAMGLLSTRRAAGSPRVAPSTAVWSLARSDVDAVAARLLDRLRALPVLPPSMFGERGFQTSAVDAVKIRQARAPIAPFITPLREGSDIGEYVARPPRHFLDRSAIAGRFRADEEWRAVRVYIRQTARYPIAAPGDGLPFRNSILAAFPGEGWSEHALLCYLNTWPIRWFHYMRNRDARQGMPQVKIAHLRALCAPPPSMAHLVERLSVIGQRLAAANAGIGGDDRAEVEGLVAEALAMTEEERRCVEAWAAKNPLPKAER